MLHAVDPKGSFFKFFNKIPFILQIVIGMVLGILLALVLPEGQDFVFLLGDLFVSALKAIAPLLVFVLVSASIARHQQGANAKLKPILVLYVVAMFLSAATALIMARLFPSTFTVLADQATASAPENVSTVLVSCIKKAVDNPVNALLSGNYIGILFWGVLFGILFRAANDQTKAVLSDFASIVSGVVRIVIRFAPLGVFGLVYASCTKEGGFSNLLGYVHVVGVLVATMLIIALVINPLLVFLTTFKNPFPLVFTSIMHSGITAFFTRSSAANIPVNMALCERLKVPRESYSISIPLGCTINMSGAAVTIVIMTMAAVNTLGIEVNFGTALLMCVASVVCACGTSGIAGGSLMLIPLACSIFGISNDIAMQVVGIGFIIGVVQDSTETALNSSSDVVFTCAANKITKVN
ncbi:MAG: serine/threonine transporter SstT [Succinivibrio sp.]|nr:serine/threonine transporter SstT [Succinivibrio sp.]MCI7772443.1 serine/threonine transporter SstT [Succinivibrio sp.]MCI7785517.1 serine/threonine transporter SstT [Succinivibrio sp.]MDD6067377.1 serine/threonine transporter SstT [Succinivibrio sp.]MDD7286218.1 serine/threonine transporter SstT [Succinivibrio sp.]